MPDSDILKVGIGVLTCLVLLVLPCILARPIAHWLEVLAGRTTSWLFGGHADKKAGQGSILRLDLTGIEIVPDRRVGPLRFGTRAYTAKAKFGPPLDWDAWGDGNLNESLVYDGVRLIFDRYRTNPLPWARLCGAEVRRADAKLFGRPLAEWGEDELSAELSRRGFQFRVLDNGYAEYVQPYLRAWFEGGQLVCIEIGE